MVCFIKQQIRKIGNRFKYEPHTTTMRNAFRECVASMLTEIKRTNGISEFSILCDESNNTMETIDRHELYMKVAIKPIKTLEYIVIDLNIMNGIVGLTDAKVVK